MTLFSEIAKVIYEIAQFIGGIVGITIFIIVFIKEGFNQTWVSGNTSFTGIGYGFVLAIVLAFLSVAPLFFFESEYKISDTDFLNPSFYLKFWIIFFLDLLFGIVYIIRYKINVRLFVVYIPLALVGASWCGKTVELMVYVINTNYFSVFLKIIYIILGVVYVILYLQYWYHIIKLKWKW